MSRTREPNSRNLPFRCSSPYRSSWGPSWTLAHSFHRPSLAKNIDGKLLHRTTWARPWNLKRIFDKGFFTSTTARLNYTMHVTSDVQEFVHEIKLNRVCTMSENEPYRWTGLSMGRIRIAANTGWFCDFGEHHLHR